MNEKNHLGILTAEARTRQRDQAASELIKGLLLINAGGAGALLIFLQAIWKDSRELATPIVIAIIILSVGAAAAAAFHLFRHQASWHHQFGTREDQEMFDRLYLGSAIISLLLFILGVATVAFGVLSKL